jgi:hypothetical protein
MHISTHHDRVWTAGCQQKEDNISAILSSHGISHTLVDAAKHHVHAEYATDNQFHSPVKYVNLAPEFWHIYRCPTIQENIYPNKHFNVMMNRISGERLMLLYMLKEAQLFEKGLIGFNCLYHDVDPDINQRQANYSQVHEDCGWHQWNELHKELLPKMPLLLDMDPDTAAMSSDITLVVESYVSDTVIAFSEKIFRALQTPRPWILFCSPGSVAVLRDAGFDVLDDVVDHSYDEIVNVEQRLQAIISELKKLKYFFLPRYKQAVETNQAILDTLKHQWSYKLQSILDNNQS